MTSTKWTAFLFINIYSTQCHVVQRSFDYFQLASSSFCNSYANAYESNTFRQLSNKFRYLHYIVHIDNLYNIHMYTFGICLYCVSVSQLYNSYNAFGIQGFYLFLKKAGRVYKHWSNLITALIVVTSTPTNNYAMHSLKTHLKNTIEYLIYITFHLPRNELGITDAFVIKTTRDQQATQSQVHQSTHVSHTHTGKFVIFWQTDEHIWTRCIPLVKFLTFP